MMSITVTVARQLAADRQRDFERRAAQQRIVRHIRADHRSRFDDLACAVRRLAAALVPHRRPVSGSPALASTATCCCSA